MTIIDRYVLRRFLINFLVLFTVLYLFVVGIDMITNLDEFVQVLDRRLGDEASTLQRLITLSGLVIDFQGPRVFLLYAYLHGLVSIGAMAFTLANMYRNKELLAVLASGVSLHRLAVPFVAAVVLVSLVQLANQEVVLHRVAPLLLRSHGEIGQRSVDEFPVDFTDDGQGNLFHAPAFAPRDEMLSHLTILQRDEAGRTVRRITAERATWDPALGGWALVSGEQLVLRDPDDFDPSDDSWREPIEFVPSELDPATLTMRRHREYLAMLSLGQIDEMLQSSALADVALLLRHRYARFAAIFVNLLVLAVALPFFLLREPANLMRQSLLCASVAVPTMMGASLGMMMDFPGITPAVGTFLPVVILIPMAIGRWTFLRT